MSLELNHYSYGHKPLNEALFLISTKMNHIYIQYRDELGINNVPKPNSDIIIYDAGQYDSVYVKVGEMKDGVPFINRSIYWDLDYYERRGLKKKMDLIKNSMIDLVARELCCENYKIMEEFEDWNEMYLKLKKLL